jgi:hypothetical protein
MLWFNKSSFKSFLELEPQVRDILFKFNESKYAICLKLMDQMKDHLLLDMYLSPHVNTLYMWIRHRALRQYFSPYKSADLRKMATAFNTSLSALEEELTLLILDGQIQARIDSQNKVNWLLNRRIWSKYKFIMTLFYRFYMRKTSIKEVRRSKSRSIWAKSFRREQEQLFCEHSY